MSDPEIELQTGSEYSVLKTTNEKPAQPAPWGSDAPDGGSTAWLVVLGAWCTSFCSFGWLSSMISPFLLQLILTKNLGIGVFQQYYQDVLLTSYSPSTISWIPSLQFFFMMAMVSSMLLSF